MESGEVYVVANTRLSPFAHTVIVVSKYHDEPFVIAGSKLKYHAELLAKDVRGLLGFGRLRLVDTREEFEATLDEILKEPEVMQHIPVQSSNIVSIAYSEPRELLEVIFNGGGKYQYSEVPHHVFDEFAKAESKGKFFQSVIKGTYKFTKVG